MVVYTRFARLKLALHASAARHKEMTILSSVLVCMENTTLCVVINLGGIPRGLRHPRDAPSVDPSTLGKYFLIRHSPPSSIVTLNGDDSKRAFLPEPNSYVHHCVPNKHERT